LPDDYLVIFPTRSQVKAVWRPSQHANLLETSVKGPQVSAHWLRRPVTVTYRVMSISRECTLLCPRVSVDNRDFYNAAVLISVQTAEGSRTIATTLGLAWHDKVLSVRVPCDHRRRLIAAPNERVGEWPAQKYRCLQQITHSDLLGATNPSMTFKQEAPVSSSSYTKIFPSVLTTV
jgi:hypothetical protein